MIRRAITNHETVSVPDHSYMLVHVDRLSAAATECAADDLATAGSYRRITAAIDHDVACAVILFVR